MILLIVDTQNSIMTNDLYEFEIFVYRIKTLIKEARNNSIEVIYSNFPHQKWDLHIEKSIL